MTSMKPVQRSGRAAPLRLSPMSTVSLTSPPSPGFPSRPPLYSALGSIDAFQRSELSLVQVEEPDEDELTEEELRELYDNEEIERFLELFSTYVTEVSIPDTPDIGPNGSTLDLANSMGRAGDEGEWTPVSTDQEGEYFPPQTETTPALPAYHSLSEEIAFRFLVPLLPPARPTPAIFTLGRLRMAIQRLYLAALPAYGPFFLDLKKLATWENPGTSSVYCTIYWALWWYNLLLPALTLRIIFALLRRRIFPYPSLQDLREHRAEILAAEEFGDQVSARLSASSSGMTEIWRIVKIFDNSKKSKVKKFKEKLKSSESLSENLGTDGEEATVLDDPEDCEGDKDVKRAILHILDDIADMHERVRNIFIWRKPHLSKKYAIILSAIFFLTLLPTHIIFKLATFILGALFWHVAPILAALPPATKDRIPPPFDDVPTDAEYAMELISQRVAAGLEVKPARANRNRKKQQSTDNLLRTETASKRKSATSVANGNGFDWKKWGGRVATGKSAVNDMKRLTPGKGWPINDVWPPRNPIIPGAVGIAHANLNVETHTYPCQHTSAPGLITLTAKTLFFTPLMSQNAKVVIQLSSVKGVKKAGLLKGLYIRWTETADGIKEQKEDKFLWVGSRDDLFARLIGSDGRRWMKV